MKDGRIMLPIGSRASRITGSSSGPVHPAQAASTSADLQAYALNDIDSVALQVLNTLARHSYIRILVCEDYSRNACADYGFAAWPLPAQMSAWFQINYKRAPIGPGSRHSERHYLGMLCTQPLVISLPDDGSVHANNHGSDHRIRTSPSPAFFCQAQGLHH